MEEGWDFDSSPPSFKQVQPLLLLLFSISGTGWLLNYITTIRTAYRDRTPGVSLIALTNNLAWELVFAILHPPPLPVAKVILRSWLFVDVFVIYTTAKFARLRVNNSNVPLLQRYLHLFVIAGILGFFSGHWALSVLLSPIKAFYWSGMMCLVVMSGSALGILVQRGHTRGMSYGMWYLSFYSTAQQQVHARTNFNGAGSHGSLGRSLRWRVCSCGRRTGRRYGDGRIIS